jgi:3-dehydroquinate synthase
MSPEIHRVQFATGLETEIFMTSLLADETALPARVLGNAFTSPHFLISDENVDRLYGDRIHRLLSSRGHRVARHVIPAGESSKTLAVYESIAFKLLDSGATWESTVVALGGGVVANVAGLVAATLYRGIDLVHIPTTLLAQVDATIDCKQAVNTHHGKNLIGAHHAPKIVMIDPTFLATLDDRNIRNGLAEVAKHALVQDSELVRTLIGLGSISAAQDWSSIVERTVALKTRLFELDVPKLERDLRLQYGHCVGHAIEHATDHVVLHGEAVAIGMCVSARLARTRGYCKAAVVSTHDAVARALDLPSWIPGCVPMDRVREALHYDKYLREGRPSLLLLETVGTPYRGGLSGVTVEFDELVTAVEDLWREGLERPPAVYTRMEGQSP